MLQLSYPNKVGYSQDRSSNTTHRKGRIRLYKLNSCKGWYTLGIPTGTIHTLDYRSLQDKLNPGKNMGSILICINIILLNMWYIDILRVLYITCSLGDTNHNVQWSLHICWKGIFLHIGYLPTWMFRNMLNTDLMLVQSSSNSSMNRMRNKRFLCQ